MSDSVGLRRATSLLQQLIAVDTTNPPGGETAAAELVAGHLRDAGVLVELVARDPNRANLVARVPGTGSGPSLTFLTHLDVAPATAQDWTVDPLGGVRKDGAIWGRGAVDMKCQVAAVATALTEIVRSGRRPAGDVVLVAVADEEVGDADVGLPWLVQRRPDLATEYAIGEGAGERYAAGGTPLYLVDVGVKQGANVMLRVRGRAGDASLSGVGTNALAELARLLTRLPERLGPVRLGPEAAAILDAILPGSTAHSPYVRLDRACELDPSLGRILRAITGVTAVPTEANAGVAANVVPPSAEATIKCVLPPSTTRDELVSLLRHALGPGAYELEVSEPNGGSRSPVATPLYAAIREFLSLHDPEARLLPTLGYGYSDCDVLRRAFGTVAYGFIPFRHVDPSVNHATKHGPNERVLLDDLAFQVEAALHVSRRLGALAADERAAAASS